MEINEKNKAIYEKAFITDGEFGKAISEPSWKPDIDENEISEWSGDDEGRWIPATPLGYRSYIISRTEGLKNILNQEDFIDLTSDKFHHIKKGDNIIKKYDKIKIESGNFVVTGDNDDSYFIASVNDDDTIAAYYVEYEK